MKLYFETVEQRRSCDGCLMGEMIREHGSLNQTTLISDQPTSRQDGESGDEDDVTSSGATQR